MTNAIRKIGFVGLGNIGQPAALKLLEQGFDVHGYDLHLNAAVIAGGGTMAASLDQIASCDIILLSLPSATALAETIEGLLPHLRAGQIIIDISSYAFEDKLAQAHRVQQAGAIMLDCEISGLPIQVADRTAVLFAAGDQEAVKACAAVFEAFTARHFYLGAFGAATKMKLIANFMVCAHNLIAAEALNLGKATGIDPALMIEVIKPSAAGSTTFANKAPLMLSRQFSQGRGPFRHMFGYLTRVAQLARENHVGNATPMLDRLREIYRRAEVEQRHDQDIAAIIETLECMMREEARA